MTVGKNDIHVNKSGIMLLLTDLASSDIGWRGFEFEFTVETFLRTSFVQVDSNMCT